MGRRKGDTGRAPVLRPREFEMLIKYLAGRRYAARDQAIATVSFYLGLRAKEIAALKIGDIYAETGAVHDTLHLKRSYTKMNKTRDVYLSSQVLRSRLSEYRLHLSGGPESPLFTTRSGRPFTANGIAHLFRELFAWAGFERGSSHSGRRTMITRLAEKGVDLKAIAVLAGHASISTTTIYIENNPFRLARYMAALDDDT